MLRLRTSSRWSSRGFEDVVAEEFGEGLAGDLLDDERGEDEVGVGVLPLGAGVEVEGLAGELVDDGERVAGELPGGDGVVLRGVVLVAGGVGEEVDDLDVAGAGELGEEFADGVLKRELALLLEEQDGRRGELLGDGADGVGHGGFGGDGRRDAREAEGVGVDDVAVLHDADGGRGNAGVGEDFLRDGGDFGGGVGREAAGRTRRR